MPKLPYKWFAFVDEKGARWRVFLSTSQVSPCLKPLKNEAPFVGITLFRRRRIYVELNQTDGDLRLTTLHELMHVALRPMMMPSGMDEDIVTYGSEGLWAIMKSLSIDFPAIPESLRGRLKR